MIDLKILRQQVELGASPQRIVDLVEEMLAEWQSKQDRELELAVKSIPQWQKSLAQRLYEERCERSLRLLAPFLREAGND